MSEIKAKKEWSSKVKTFFLVPISKDFSSALEKVKTEAKQNGDIIILDLEDNETLQTIKAIHMMEYYLQKCFKRDEKNRKTPLLFKTTDSVVIMPEEFMKMVDGLTTRTEENFAAGAKAQAYRLEFVSASAYFLSYNAVNDVYQYARCVTDIPQLEDVFLTGAIAEKIRLSLVGANIESNYGGIEDKKKKKRENLLKFAVINNATLFTSDYQYSLWYYLKNIKSEL